MVGVGVAEGGGGSAGPGDGYYGEYYPPEQYYVPQEMCPHPSQHPQHTHMCTVLPEYGGMPVVTSGTMMPQMMPPVINDSMQHYLLHAQPHPHHAPHHQPPHHQTHHQPPPHHQPPHHYGPTNGTGGPQHFYGTGYYHVPPHHMQHSPPPPVYQKDERTQRQYTKMKRKLASRNDTNRNNGTMDVKSGASTPSLSPRKEMNGRCGGSGGGSSGAWSEGEGSSAGASVHGDDENDTQALLDLLCATRTPQVREITPTSALVQWNSPLPEGVSLPNVELTYDLLLGDRGRYKAIYSGTSLSCRVRDLRPGCEYSVCLQIRAGEVTGAASEAATFRAPAAPPERASAARVIHQNRNSLQLRWPTAHDNGARLLHYILEMDDGEGFAEIARPRTRQHTVNNLRPQTCYRFRMAAVNECGQGETSEETVAWTTGSPPAAPAPPTLLCGTSDSLELGWERRADEEFTLQMDDPDRGHGFLPVYSGSDCSYKCGDLRRATDYRFRLRCETTYGQGSWSTEVTYRTLSERPGPPGRPSVRGRIHSRALRLRWDAPADDGGAVIEYYILELDSGEGYKTVYRGSEREAHCDRLQPGTSYRARVRCANEMGEGEWSATETITTEAACPEACGVPELVAEPRSTLLAIRWRPPDSTGGAPLNEYRVEVAEEDSSARVAYQGLDTQCTVRDLTPGRQYRVWVTAYNRVGSGPSSASLAFTTAPAPPDAPEVPVAQLEGAYAARLEWTAPKDNGAPVLDYRLEMSATNVNEAFAEVYRGAETSYLVSSLIPFSPYFFRVCACNAAGRGAWSGVRDVLTPRAPPAAPAALHYEATPHSLCLQWRPPASHGADILGYKVKVEDVEYDTEGATPEHLVEGLSPDTAYRVRVAALNELGIGEWSEEARATTRPPPPEPPQLRCAQAAHNYLRLEWAAAGGEGLHYCVEMRSAEARDFRPVYRGSARACKVKKLRETAAYAFRIRASDERGGRGACSPPYTFHTLAAPPAAPRPPALLLTGPRTALASWDAIDDVEYLLQCARGKDALFKQVYRGSGNQYQLEELEAGAEYTVRLCVVRSGMAGAWSGTTRLVVPLPIVVPRVKRPRPVQVTLHARHVAIIMAALFLLLAVGVAVLLQRLFETRP